ncbi:MAG: CDP-diacylglycerol--glycerol-3-phosphate 3-phosphatidyltransferase [Nocardioidaceae bacterium]
MTDQPAQAAASDASVPTIWNVANALTTLRVLMVPLLGWLLLSDGGHDTGYRLWAFLVFLVAILTDRIDGDLARKHNLVTKFGTLMDPIADKALTGMAFIGLSIIGQLWWWVTIAVLGREWFVTFLRFWVIRHGVIPVSRGGKIKTTAQAIALMGFILPLELLPDGLHLVGAVLWWVAVAVMVFAVAVTLGTGVDYVRAAMRVRRLGHRSGRPSP